MDAKRPATAQTEVSWTTRRLLNWMTGYFESHDVPSPRIVGEMLLAHVLGCDRMRLYMEADRPAAPAELQRLRELVARAGRHEPVHYLVGKASFYLLEFLVNETTLIPQPSTETIVEHVLGLYGREPKADSRQPTSEEGAPSEPRPPGSGPAVVGEGDEEASASGPLPGDHGSDEPSPEPLLIADIGTGTGCIAVTLAKRLPQARVVATDIRADALDLARRNAERHGVADRIELVEGAGAGALAAYPDAGAFDVVCSNPPYVADADIDRMDAAVRDHVPRSAWYGGTDGLDAIRPLMAEAPRLLKRGGHLLIEIGDDHKDAVLALAAANRDLTGAEVLRDGDGFWRVLAAERSC
jgi:release factor glutamine methyltransferase